MPCFNCEKRYVGCHSSCEEYAEFKDQKEINRKQKKRQNIFYDYIFEYSDRQRRKNGKK